MRRITAALVIATSLATEVRAVDSLPGERHTRMLGLQLIKSTLADVQRRFGGTIVETGDAGEYEAALCYFDPGNATVVTFRSGELGGTEHELLGFELNAGEGAVASGCRIADGRSLPTDGWDLGGLRLGMTRERFARVLGSVEKQAPWGVGRTFERQETVAPKERPSRQPPPPGYDKWDVIITVAGEFKNGVLVRLAVWKTVTF